MEKSIISRLYVRFALSLALSAAALPALAADAQGIEGDRYFKDGQETLAARRALKPNKRPAKNVILLESLGEGKLKKMTIIPTLSKKEEGRS